MILLVSGATATVRRYLPHPALGRLTQPRCGNLIAEIATCGADWAADNNALQGIDPDGYLAMLDGIAAAPRQHLRYVAVPDAVELTPTGPRGDWNGTLWLWKSWLPALKRRGLPAACVAQDGATVDSMPWPDMAALFIGGSTAWKLGVGAAHLIGAAKARRVWVHVGRVNSLSRLDKIEAMGADSFDGGQFSMFPDRYIPRYLARLEHRQESFLGAA